MFLPSLSNLGLHFVHVLEAKARKGTRNHIDELLVPESIETNNDMITGKGAFESASGFDYHTIRRRHLEWFKVYLAISMTDDNSCILRFNQQGQSAACTDG